jgi:hypothetical protein
VVVCAAQIVGMMVVTLVKKSNGGQKEIALRKIHVVHPLNATVVKVNSVVVRQILTILFLPSVSKTRVLAWLRGVSKIFVLTLMV